MTTEPLCACGHPTDGIPFMWAPGHFSSSKCVCCLRRIWEKTLADVTNALAHTPPMTPEECANRQFIKAQAGGASPPGAPGQA